MLVSNRMEETGWVVQPGEGVWWVGWREEIFKERISRKRLGRSGASGSSEKVRMGGRDSDKGSERKSEGGVGYCVRPRIRRGGKNRRQETVTVKKG
jgi:hypothetical protein